MVRSILCLVIGKLNLQTMFDQFGVTAPIRRGTRAKEDRGKQTSQNSRVGSVAQLETINQYKKLTACSLRWLAGRFLPAYPTISFVRV